MSHSLPRRRALPLLLAAGVLAAACTPPPAPDGTRPPPPPATMEESALVSSLRVETGDTVRLTLQVTNPSAAPVSFTFPSGQSYDFAVRPAGGGAEAWRWSEQMGFTQAVRTVTLAPGETWTFGERWTPPPGTRGEFTAVARLTSSDHPVERTATFRLP
jgi:Intracellular proteinase inhibitor